MRNDLFIKIRNRITDSAQQLPFLPHILLPAAEDQKKKILPLCLDQINTHSPIHDLVFCFQILQVWQFALHNSVATVENNQVV